MYAGRDIIIPSSATDLAEIVRETEVAGPAQPVASTELLRNSAAL